MKLRMRLGLTVVAAAIPVVVTLGWFQRYVAENAIRDVLVQTTLETMTGDERQRCETSPGQWQGGRPGGDNFPDGPPPGPPPRGDRRSFSEERPGGPPDRPFRGEGPPPPPPRFGKAFAYDNTGRSLNPKAPQLDFELREAVATGEAVASRRTQIGQHEDYEVLVKMAWNDGPCAYILHRQPAPPELSRRPGLLPLGARLFPIIIALGAVLMALGPVIRRIRKLASQVRTSAREQYRKPITVHGDDEIAELARAFQDAGNEINTYIAEQELREKALRDFVANTTHDVMLPLSVLHGQLAAIREQVQEGKPVESTIVSAAMKEAHYMGALVRNLAAAAKLEAGTPQLQLMPTNLSELVERVAARHAIVAREHRIELEHAEPELPVWVQADMTLVEQAISNIVYNAVLYNKPGGHVAVLLASAAEGKFLLRVVDDGPGVPEAELAKLAQRHYRSDAARSRNPGGLGLGLDIAHRVAGLHGWELVIHRSEYGGLEVSLRTPVVGNKVS